MSNLTPKTAWMAIEARLSGIERATSIYTGFLRNGTAKRMPEADDVLHQSCSQIWDDISIFEKNFQDSTSIEVKSAIQRFQHHHAASISRSFDENKFIETRVGLIKLVALVSEISHLMNGYSEQIRSTTDLAFLHLQRMIAVDQTVRANWIAAFTAGEPYCEKLGAVHLLWHGILAFKIDGIGARTDLVYEDSLDKIPKGAQGLVLTEWKKTSISEVGQQFNAAEQQVDSYKGGVLGSVELSNYRYLIAVTDKAVVVPSDKFKNGITYRHINIAVDPETPSKSAPKLARSASSSTPAP